MIMTSGWIIIHNLPCDGATCDSCDGASERAKCERRTVHHRTHRSHPSHLLHLSHPSATARRVIPLAWRQPHAYPPTSAASRGSGRWSPTTRSITRKWPTLFAGDPRDAHAWREAIARTHAHPRARDAMADILRAQQQQRGAPAEAVTAAARLRDPKTVAVVTGQQAGLFGGPLFTLLKALTAIELAEHVQREHGVSAVALFWIDAEDHDWDEVKSCGVLDASLQHRTITIGNPPGAQVEPVARVRLDASVGAAIAELTATLPETEFTAPMIEMLRAAYDPGIGMADAFGRWMESVLGRRGLIVYDSSDRPPSHSRRASSRGNRAARARPHASRRKPAPQWRREATRRR